MFHLPKTLPFYGAALAAVALLLAAPRAVHAIAAALVQVTNTPANPVPNKDVDNPARHPFTAACTAQGDGFDGPVSCNPTPEPAAGVETVIQSISMLVTRTAGTGTPVETYYTSTTRGQSYQNYVPFITQQSTPSGVGAWVGNQAATIYEDPSTFHECSAVQSDFTTQLQMNCTVTGYTVSLP